VAKDITDDVKLVATMLEGADSAFNTFFAIYFPRLYRFALVRLDHDEDAAEEVVQRTLCLAIDKLHTYRGEAALFTWLCTLARHEIGAELRRRRRHQPVALVEDQPEVRAVLESLAAVAGDPEETSLHSEVARLVHVALDSLPPHYGDSLEWKYIEGSSVKDIALRLGIGAKAAESLLTRARAAFREAFSALVGGDGWALARTLEGGMRV
jgi:RNA polymerase sigma-70 factor (ECF subfamily)